MLEFEFEKRTGKLDEFITGPDSIGILIGRSDPINNPLQFHCGIVFRSDNKINVLHLEWHHSLSVSENISEFTNYIYVKSKLIGFTQQAVSAMCRLIVKKKSENKIPYALRYKGGSFSNTGILKLEETEFGLTCATFVLAVFKSCSISLIDILNWSEREIDSCFHISVVNALERSKEYFHISDEHIENVKNEIGCSRFRPEEVAISISFENIPENSEIIRCHGLGLNLYLSKE